ncbi:protein-glutamate O-methyltransferase [Agrilus planipennis]|uniref:Sugar phosphate phosphatase n=1 Tax=Agrilus planipennis TaxID=224129 RepID=A0A1W4WPV1_AGRPL|nr:protein-glutamate O-methyltransferase [Agrilus planipennis]XP_018325937.1 protein-glutamate O-methyltransferase [Agrilus planipennis]XP_018325938.1 protein-glutamate O-methyltransferase [Agrilus planipennis]XP_018325939.1 protein-glutamate O-methyltransferase [Agrilus planipennis]XP_018325940.1 protein-glutamate O-methyltransferase [Agrilus planipennis]XP_018325943.1 protein-glutamate O-methyltransferase [Agrilus planipennis]XP_018325944.1 protein-glutamate O-methyltransferase [Agrilus pla
MDLVTPRNVHYNAFYKRSFAYYTMKERIPVILTQLIDNLVRNKDKIISEYGQGAGEELKIVIGEISKIKYEVQTNKPLQEIVSSAPDIKIYNDYLAKQATDDGWPTYFNCVWLLAECYIYRKLYDIFEKTNTLKDFDLFRYQKELALIDSIDSIIFMCKSLSDMLLNEKALYPVKDMFIHLLKLNLWGNRQDLSITNGVVNHVTGDPMSNLENLESYIISDHSEDIWSAISDPAATSQIVDIVLDNAAYELYFDFCLADYLLKNNLASKVRFYVKNMPWFISDAMTRDVNWQIKQLRKHSNKYVSLFGQQWDKHFKDGSWTVEVEDFWTYPLDYSYMKCLDNKLYRKLAEAKLIIFKGDLNYRKLFGERNWDPITPIEKALQGFHPSKLCTLRTVKCDIVCGLRDGLVEELEAKNAQWSYKGDYGMIQFCEKVEQ